MEPIKPDILYVIDKLIAARPDGGTISDSISETLGVSKSGFHKGLVRTASALAAYKVVTSVRHPAGLVLALGAVWFGGKIALNYLEAPRLPG